MAIIKKEGTRRTLLSNQKYKKTEKACWLMILPTLIGFCLFTLYPITWAVRYAFFDYDGFRAYYVGLDNFVRVFFRDARFWKTLGNTFLLTFGKLAIEIPLALFLAVTVNNKLKGNGFFRLIFFLPNIISVAVAGLMFYFLFDTANGFVNACLLNWNIINQPINWFGDGKLAMLVIALASIWQGFGVNMMLLLSGVQGISKDLYECAALDGATKTQQFRYVTLPMLAPVMQVVLLLAITGSMKTTDLVLTLTNGQPAGKTDVIMTYIFKFFFSQGDANAKLQYGYATAMSIVVAIILGVLALLYMRATKKKAEIY